MQLRHLFHKSREFELLGYFLVAVDASDGLVTAVKTVLCFSDMRWRSALVRQRLSFIKNTRLVIVRRIIHLVHPCRSIAVCDREPLTLLRNRLQMLNTLRERFVGRFRFAHDSSWIAMLKCGMNLVAGREWTEVAAHNNGTFRLLSASCILVPSSSYGRKRSSGNRLGRYQAAALLQTGW